MNELLPIATGDELRDQAKRLGRRHRRGLAGMVGLHAAAAAAGLAGPLLLGSLVQSVVDGTTRSHIDQIVLVLAGFLVAETVLTWFARRASFVLSERIFAELREDFMRRVLGLPLSTVERAGTGDLVSRTTADVDSLARTVRFAVPETLIAAVTTVLTVAAAVWVSPLAALPCIAGVPLLFFGTRWYLHRAPAGYLWERASYATLAGTVSETVEGGRTVEALSLREERVDRIDADLDNAYQAEMRTLFLRTVWFPTAEFAYVLPVAASLAWGGWLVSNGQATIGEVTAVALYVVKLADPVDRLISWLDEIQVGATSFARLVGIVRVPPDREAKDDEPESNHLRARGRPLRLRREPRRPARHRPRPRAGRARRRRRSLRRGQVDARTPARRHPPAARGPRRGGRRSPRRPAARHAAEGGRARHAGAARLRRHDRREPAARPALGHGRAAGRVARGRRRARVGRRSCPRCCTRWSVRAVTR